MLKKVIRIYLQKISSQKLIFLAIFIGSIVWSVTMFRSGLRYNFGYGFWGPNGHDGIWHIALSQSLSKGHLNNPVFFGNDLKNYHLGFDYLLAFFYKFTGIPIANLYFQILPILFSLLIGILTYRFVLNWRKSPNEALWVVLFVYFGYGFGFVITFFRDLIISGESMFWSQQSISTLVNPPYALSLVVILSGLVSLQKKKGLLSSLFFGLLLPVKAYSAILILIALFILGVYFYINTKNYMYLKVFIGSFFINLFFLSLVKNDGLSAFVWQPFWFLETMMSYSDRLGWERFYSAMTTYRMGDIWLKGFVAYSVAMLIFVIGNMGTRIFGIYYFFKNKLDHISILLTSIAIFSLIIPTFFVQKGTPWNTIQFFYYGMFIFSIFAGIVVSRFNIVYKSVFVVLAIPGTWSTLQHYLPTNPQAMVSISEIQALEFLRSKPDGVVLTYPFDINKAKSAEDNPPRPLYFYDSTAYVSAFADKQMFMEDEVNLNIMGYKWYERREDVLRFFTDDLSYADMFLKNNNIKYLYLAKANTPLFGETLKHDTVKLNLNKIFENSESVIYSVGK